MRFIYAKTVRLMPHRKLLQEIRSMSSAASVEAERSQLVSLLKSECSRSPPSLHDLCKVSMLCGAFCRRLATLDTIAASDVAKHAESLSSSINCSAPSAQVPLFAYALGEVEGLRNTRRLRYRQRLDDLTKGVPASRWDTEHITRCITELSLFEKLPARRRNDQGPPKRVCGESDIGGGSGPVAVRCQLPLRDPISLSVIATPARGVLCQHHEVFDLSAFVRTVQLVAVRRGESVDGALIQRWGTGGVGAGLGSSSDSDSSPAANCPFCGKYTSLQNVRVDEALAEAMARYSGNGGVLSVDCVVVWDMQSGSYNVMEKQAEVRPVCVKMEGDVMMEAEQRRGESPLGR
ncbi:hypothetical protein, conserved [Trypanosoma brucei brucei TREU927]|uniref:Uncharacterized protein n=1 Tax=Trypanosoma brucei brucei (strain 927/4 GUTat10.1) TaxID=185431 RepID=Q57V61_TRYB2|nr:hypothetical protein, conserved [Trypanosoma brucei brucei TREU927]AAX70507.1 hypothetical protein, conserved [Trypanosoma brucei]AAZ10359.1 hypothetical protein, conserved [Trypanosoma brucei brucei TREU927]